MVVSGLWGRTMVYAQDQAIPEADFWTLLAQTYVALESSTGQEDRLSHLRATWETIDNVRLRDDSIVPVDVEWLISGLAETNADQLKNLQTRIKALLDYHAAQVEANGSGNPLTGLDRVLQDRRFQYPDTTPTPAPPQDDFSLPDLPQLSAGLSQIVLIIAGIAILVAVFAYFLRGLRVQGGAIREPLDTGEDPETAADARELAQSSEQSRDYRSAVRYLYLSSLLMLDERGLIHYDRTLTNREHLQQITDKPNLLEVLRSVVNTFDRVWYGFARLDEARYQAFCRDVERLREMTP
jgi:hypothetical protein